MRLAFGLLVCLLFAGVYSRPDVEISRRGRELCADCGDLRVGTMWQDGNTPDSPIPGIDSASACCDECQSRRPGCVASVFQTGSPGQRSFCYLKTTINPPVDCMTCESVNFNERELDARYSPEYGVDRYGNDIQPYPTYQGVSDPNVCGEYCVANPECVGFIWRRDHWHCWLKFELNPEAISCPACVLGHRPE